jgi:hypothetical protein
MMLILRDDRVIEVFDSFEHPPVWIESIDVENGEYQFCDDKGQRFVGVVGRHTLVTQAEWHLRPTGEPDIRNALGLVEKAVMIESNSHFPDLDSLKRHIASKGSCHGA